MRLRNLRILTAVASVLALAACGSSGPAASSSSAGQDPVALTVAVWTSDAKQLSVMNGIAADYRSHHPEISSITFETLPFDSFDTALTTRIAAGSAPDLAWIVEKAAPEYIAGGALLDVGPAMRSDPNYQYSDVVPGALQVWSSGDQVYGYPFSTSAFGVFYNKDLLTAAGQPLPADLQAKGTWTWEEARTIAAKAAPSGGTGLVFDAFDYKNWDNLATLWDAYGASPWSSDGTTCTFGAPEMVNAMKFFHDGVYVDHAFPTPGTSPDFFAGQSAMIVTQISRAAKLADAGFGWGLVPLPTGPAGAKPVFGQAAVAALTAGKHHAEATAFLLELTNQQSSKKLAAFFPPPRTSLLNSATLGAANPALTSKQIDDVLVDGVTHGQVKASHPRWAALNDQVRSALDSLWTPDGDPAKILQQLCTALTPQLGK